MAVRPIALHYIGEDLDRCRAEIHEIDQDVENLNGKREALLFRLDALSAAYDRAVAEAKKEAEAEASNGTQSSLGLSGQSKNRVDQSAVSGGSLAGIGFRDAVRQILSGSRKGMRPKDVAKAMIDGGYEYTGKTDLSARLSNELYRMVKSNSVRKRGHLYYGNL